MNDMREITSQDNEFYSYAEALDSYVEACQDPQAGVGTGYSLDRECGEMSTGELALLWARSGAGKSTLLLNIINNTPDIPTVFFNMEMRARTMAEWLLTMGFGVNINYKQLKDIILNGDQDPRYHDVMARLEESKHTSPPKVWFVEPRSPTIADLQRTVDRVTLKSGIRPVRVMIDHLSLMRGARDYEGVVSMGEQLHQWAQDDELAVVVAQQTGRSGGSSGERNDGHLPVTLSSGVFGGEHDADWIYGAWRPERNPQFRKSRNEFKSDTDYQAMLSERYRVKGMTHFAVIKNRPYGTLLEDGATLFWNFQTRRLEEST